MNTKKWMNVGRFIGLIVVTVFAVAVMWATGMRRGAEPTVAETPTSQLAAPAAPVAVEKLTREPVEILGIYAGMVRPFERFTVGFEVAGRIDQLGNNGVGDSLDEGHRVQTGQVLAQLDQRILKARVDETTARLEQAQQELNRAKKLKQSSGVISETNFQTKVTELAVAEAQAATAQKNLEDGTLLAPCDGVISRRLINNGESIAMHQTAFEIVQVNQVLLVVGVPESRVGEIEMRRRRLQSDGRGPRDFRVYVQLMGTDRLGRKWPLREGSVYRIGETADDKTGLFEVEILLDNADRNLRPGIVAQAKIVLDELSAFRIPLDAVLFRGSEPYYYVVQPSESDLRIMFWDVGPSPDYIVRQVKLDGFVEQEGMLIVPEIAEQDRRIVTRGQHRLVEGRRVRIVDPKFSKEIPERVKSESEIARPMSKGRPAS